MDLLPTLVALASAGDLSSVVGELDGRSLLPHLSGSPDRDEVVAEYLAEGAIAPIVMIRKGRHKFVHSPADPDQLFDLSSDPDERFNIAERPEHARLVSEFRADVAARWDLPALDEQVRLSQRRRRAVDAALRTGTEVSWDYSPAYNASRRYIRNDKDLGDLEDLARFPPVRRRGA